MNDDWRTDRTRSTSLLGMIVRGTSRVDRVSYPYELRRLLVRDLLARPDNGEPWLFLSQKSHSKINKKIVNKWWKEKFHPEYAGTEQYRPVTSHFGRHRFTTWWRVEQDVNRELVKYMRGDKPGGQSAKTREAIDAYLHTYYEDIRDLYLKNIYKLNI